MRKKLFALLAALALCLSLTACGGTQDDTDDLAGGDWRTTGVVRAEGTITRDGGDVYVLVCVNDDDAVFCYDDETYAVYDYVDRNGDGDSDVAMLFELDGAGVLMVWFWDAEAEAFVFQPEESQVEGSVEAAMDHEGFEGTWYLDGDETEVSVIIIGTDGDWVLYDQQGDTRTAMDSGMIEVLDEAQGHYTAVSEVYDSVSYNLVTAGADGFYWGVSGAYEFYERLD